VGNFIKTIPRKLLGEKPGGSKLGGYMGQGGEANRGVYRLGGGGQLFQLLKNL